ncbi:hypothetical protein ABW19_dt0201500 [Dactylella cylindrospora]|nr:hypothetical protein ABW19_dt0201500 [Dactylella cylindrospora]
MNTMVPSLEPKLRTFPLTPSSSPPPSCDSDDKMSSSHSADSKIEFIDDLATITHKIMNANCLHRDTSNGNGVLALLRDIIWPISQIRMERHRGEVGYNISEGAELGDTQLPFVGDHAPQGAVFSLGNKHYMTYEDLEQDFKNGNLRPAELKRGVIHALNELLEPIRRIYEGSEEWRRVDAQAYPDGAY